MSVCTLYILVSVQWCTASLLRDTNKITLQKYSTLFGKRFYIVFNGYLTDELVNERQNSNAVLILSKRKYNYILHIIYFLNFDEQSWVYLMNRNLPRSSVRGHWNNLEPAVEVRYEARLGFWKTNSSVECGYYKVSE